MISQGNHSMIDQPLIRYSFISLSMQSEHLSRFKTDAALIPLAVTARTIALDEMQNQANTNTINGSAIGAAL